MKDNTDIHKLVIDLFDREATKIDKLDDALTTNAYRIHFEGRKNLILKIAYDPKDIKEGKGRKEVNVLRMLTSELPKINAPIVEGYWDAGEITEGYIVALQEMPGKSLSIEEFNKVALSQHNIDSLIEDTLAYQSMRFNNVTDFATFRDKQIADYIDKYKNKAERYLMENHFPRQIIDKLKFFAILKNYFKDSSNHLLHRDVKFNNILFKDGEYMGIIDWEGAFTAPIAFDFAHIMVLSKIYGYEKWMSLYLNRYIEISGNTVLKSEVEALLLFAAFRYMCRGHIADKNNKNTKVYLNLISNSEIRL